MFSSSLSQPNIEEKKNLALSWPRGPPYRLMNYGIPTVSAMYNDYSNHFYAILHLSI